MLIQVLGCKYSDQAAFGTNPIDIFEPFCHKLYFLSSLSTANMTKVPLDAERVKGVFGKLMHRNTDASQLLPKSAFYFLAMYDAYKKLPIKQKNQDVSFPSSIIPNSNDNFSLSMPH